MSGLEEVLLVIPFGVACWSGALFLVVIIYKEIRELFSE